MRIVDLQLSFPAILLALVLAALLGQGKAQLVIALVTAQYAYFARTALRRRRRRAPQGLRRGGAATPLPGARVVFRHILPNCLPPLIVVATVQVANAIALEATLSFLGLGLPPTEPSLGMLIANGFQYMMSGPLLDLGLSRHRADRDHRRASTSSATRSATSSIRGCGDDARRVARGARTSRRISSPGRRGEGGRRRVVRVARGEVLGLVGESGSGKSVTGFSLIGLVDPPGRIVAGSVRLEGGELSACRTRRCARARREASRWCSRTR